MKNKSLFVFFVAMLIPMVAIAEDNRNVYMCTKCSEIVATETRPGSSGCSKGPYHIWGNIGRVGNNAFICQKCNMVVYTAYHPNCGYSEKYGYHNWMRLGEFAQTIYECRNCGVSAYLKEQPKVLGCSNAKGGLHDWHKK